MSKIFEIIPVAYLPKNPDCNACITCANAEWLLNEVHTKGSDMELDAKCYCHKLFTYTWGNGAKENVYVCTGNPEFIPNLEKLKLNNNN
jgi:hypothetical protein